MLKDVNDAVTSESPTIIQSHTTPTPNLYNLTKCLLYTFNL